MFISPTEPERLRKIGISSTMPEEYGVDIMWNSKLGLIGVQRKEFPNDFLASVHDGRLNREYAMMKALDVAILVLEGRPNWTLDGQLIRNRNGKRHAWDRTQHRNYLASVQLRGIQVHTTDDISDTVRFLTDLRKWGEKDHHVGLDSRPAARRTDWGSIENSDYVKYMYQSLPGVGPVQAEAIYNHLGVVISLNVSEEELQTVPGIGKGRAGKIARVFRRKS